MPQRIGILAQRNPGSDRPRELGENLDQAGPASLQQECGVIGINMLTRPRTSNFRRSHKPFSNPGAAVALHGFGPRMAARR